MARYDTAQTIVNDVAIEVGLAASGDVFASTDANVVLLRTLLKRAGRDLAQEFPWSQLVREATITVAEGDAGVYDLPADFQAMRDASAFDRGTKWAVSGPISSQQWQYLQTTTTTPYRVGFRIAQNQIWLHPTSLTVGKIIAFEYQSRFWAMTDSESAPDKDAPTANTDTVLYDPEVISRLLKLKFLETRGFDTTAAVVDFKRALENAKSNEPAPVLSLNGPASGDRLVDAANLPDTGWGS